jgi:hypothetical protein
MSSLPHPPYHHGPQGPSQGCPLPHTSPSRIALIETEQATLWLYRDAGILHHKIHRPVPHRQLQDLLAASLEHRERCQAVKWLFDDRESARVGETLTLWARFARQASLKWWAIVLPTSTIGKMQLIRFVEESLPLGAMVKSFPNDDEALRWLESLDRDEPAGG